MSTLGSIGLTDVVKYAGASGDTNPMHYDTEYAKAAGFPAPFAMGALHSAWLISRLFADEQLGLSDTSYQLQVRFQRIVPLNVLLSYETVTESEQTTATLKVEGKPAATVQISRGEKLTELEPEGEVQRTMFPVEQGMAKKFADAVHWAANIAPGKPASPTFVATITAWIEQPDAIARVGFSQPRTLAGGTKIEAPRGSVVVGDTYEVVEFVTNRFAKEGSRGAMRFADLVTEFRKDGELLVRYTNTFIETPAEASESPTENATESFQLWGSKDPVTGDVFWPEREWGVDGSMRELERVPLSNEGVLYSWTTFMGQAYGQIDLPEGPRIQCELEGEQHVIGETYTLQGNAEGWRFTHA